MLFVFGKLGGPISLKTLVNKIEEPKTEPKPIGPELKNYAATLSCIAAQRKILHTDLQNAAQKSKALEKASTLWTSYMVDSIFPYWYGTEWDFNGHTDIPRKGQIACGYFVSTTLKHSGVKLDRYKLARMAASDIIDRVCEKGSAKWFRSIKSLQTHLKAKGAGLYVLGLDYHVGFVLREKGKDYFIHSDYFNDKVTKELLSASTAANSTGRYYVGSLSGNEALVKGWLNGNKLL